MNPVNLLLIDKRIIVAAVKSLDWMIQHIEWANEQTGLEQEGSPELKEAIDARDKLLKRISQ
jgi:hypothetical protein